MTSAARLRLKHYQQNECIYLIYKRLGIMTIFPDFDMTFQKNLNKSMSKYIPTCPVNYAGSKYVFFFARLRP